MYFPYLRGRQNELLALMELVSDNIIGTKVIPILEPIKMNSTLVDTLKTFILKGKQIAIVVNPKVGALNERFLNKEEDMDFSDISKEFYGLLQSPLIIKSIILDKKVADILVDKEDLDKYLIINTSRESFYIYDVVFKHVSPLYTLVPLDSRFDNIVKRGKILLEDNFVKRNDNKEYECDTSFSNTLCCYKDKGFDGVSDYSIVGKEFRESRFAPTSVVIHLIYKDDKDNLRIHNCVSDSNNGIENPIREFNEALTKLIDFCDNKKVMRTKGLEEMYKCYKEHSYLSLGVIKKLSIMHHIELVNNYLEEKE